MPIYRAKQKAWTEEQEDELQRLFMANQESPQTDQDVIDWILESLEEKSRTRRSVIKKLKELGLIFKAPTKKSAAAASNRNLFIQEEDDKLRELYDEHRLEEDCLGRIMEVFNKKRSKKAVLKRMVQLGLIAEESEILPLPRKQKQNRETDNMESENDMEDEGQSARFNETDEDSSDDEGPPVTNMGEPDIEEPKRHLPEVALDSSDDESQQMVIKRKKKLQTSGLEINTQELKQRLAELDDSSDDDDQNESLVKSKRNFLESSDEDETIQSTAIRRSSKRDRSEVDDDSQDENEMNATNNQLKRVRQITDSSDDE